MKTFNQVAAQGEITIVRVKKGRGPLPKGYSPLPLENGKFVIGHSETGHHHVLSKNDGVQVGVLETPPAGMRILYAVLENPVSLDHLREFDKHDSIVLEPGEYEFRIAREFDPYEAMARLAAD